MAIMEQPPILSRMNRLDNVVRHLEEMRGSSWRRSYGGGSSSTASPSTYSEGRSSSSIEENYKSSCRPMDDVVSETEHKGTLLHRLSLLEDRVLELCLQLEKEMEQHHSNSNSNDHSGKEEKQEQRSTPTKKSFKQFVKSCVKPKSKSKNV